MCAVLHISGYFAAPSRPVEALPVVAVIVLIGRGGAQQSVEAGQPTYSYLLPRWAVACGPNMLWSCLSCNGLLSN